MQHLPLVVFLLALAVLCGAVVSGSVRYARSLAPLRTQLGSRPPDFARAVQVKRRLWPGIWGTKTLAGMTLRTFPGVASVSLAPPARRLLPGTGWIFGSDTTSVSSLHRLGTDWVVLSGPSGSRSAQVALRSASGHAEIRMALSRAGFDVRQGEPGSGG